MPSLDKGGRYPFRWQTPAALDLAELKRDRKHQLSRRRTRGRHRKRRGGGEGLEGGAVEAFETAGAAQAAGQQRAVGRDGEGDGGRTRDVDVAGLAPLDPRPDQTTIGGQTFVGQRQQPGLPGQRRDLGRDGGAHHHRGRRRFWGMPRPDRRLGFLGRRLRLDLRRWRSLRLGRRRRFGGRRRRFGGRRRRFGGGRFGFRQRQRFGIGGRRRHEIDLDDGLGAVFAAEADTARQQRKQRESVENAGQRQRPASEGRPAGRSREKRRSGTARAVPERAGPGFRQDHEAA